VDGEPAPIQIVQCVLLKSVGLFLVTDGRVLRKQTFPKLHPEIAYEVGSFATLAVLPPTISNVVAGLPNVNIRMGTCRREPAPSASSMT
jgi:hypothetical protein